MRLLYGLFALAALGVILPATGLAGDNKIRVYSVDEKGYVMGEKVIKTDAEWKKLLNEKQYHILREKGTEKAYTGALWDNHEHGIYKCAACGLDLFSSETKYNSETGWPSFFKPIAKENVIEREDSSWFMTRTEILCARCESHLGHVFTDGPAPTGLRYCMNSAALTFEKK